MAFSFNHVLRLFGADNTAKHSKPAFESQRQVYDFCRNGYNQSGGPNRELRQLYANYVKTSSHERRDKLGTNSRKNLPQELHLRRS